ncbi:hypothetical protein HDU98_007375 [Podochytrium sp. JEL0797]|nr:hypothetical protein HDU98_007375 [Podochytrium sp. JEL0797]
MVSKQNGSFNKHDSFVLEAKTGDAVQACGFVQINGYSGFVNMFELDDDIETVSWTAATIELLSWLQEYHFLYRVAKDAAVKALHPEPIPEISESDVVAVTESVEKIKFARVPNLTRFLQTITPILNHRLKSSITFANFSCTIAITLGIHSAPELLNSPSRPHRVNP